MIVLVVQAAYAAPADRTNIMPIKYLFIYRSLDVR